MKYITAVLAPSTFAQVHTSQSMMGRVHHLSLVGGEKRRDGIAVSVRAEHRLILVQVGNSVET